MSSLNKVFIIGRVGRDPETRHTQTGQTVASFSVATDESYKDKQGNKVDAVEWHSITAFGKTADFVSNYLSKGRLVYVEGKIKTEKYTDKQSVEKYATKIMADRVQGLDKRDEGPQQAAPQDAAPGRPEYTDMGDSPF
jgi:single-strand DNA-binding protein